MKFPEIIENVVETMKNIAEMYDNLSNVELNETKEIVPGVLVEEKFRTANSGKATRAQRNISNCENSINAEGNIIKFNNYIDRIEDYFNELESFIKITRCNYTPAQYLEKCKTIEEIEKGKKETDKMIADENSIAD